MPHLQRALADKATVDLKPFASNAQKKIAAVISDFQKNEDGVRVAPKKPFVFVSPASQKVPEEISLSASKINVLAPKTPSKEITPSQGVLHLDIELTKDVNGIGMGVLFGRDAISQPVLCPSSRPYS